MVRSIEGGARRLEHDDTRLAARDDQRGRDVPDRLLHLAPDRAVRLHELLQLRTTVHDTVVRTEDELKQFGDRPSDDTLNCELKTAIR